MSKDIIKIPASNYGKLDESQDILMALGRVANNYRFRLRDPDGHLDAIMDKYQNDVNNASKEVNKRLDIWEGMLLKYYKMTCISEANNFTYEHTSFIFPYKLIRGNNTLWMLEVKLGDNYNGGVIDHNYTIDSDWNYDTYLEEITEEEFRKQACSAVSHVIDRRLERLNTPSPKYRIVEG